jgi:hypothetical protein
MVAALDAHLARAFDLTFEVGLVVCCGQTPRLSAGEKNKQQGQSSAGEERVFHARIDF